jgi:hypothetical protein
MRRVTNSGYFPGHCMIISRIQYSTLEVFARMSNARNRYYYRARSTAEQFTDSSGVFPWTLFACVAYIRARKQ